MIFRKDRSEVGPEQDNRSIPKLCRYHQISYIPVPTPYDRLGRFSCLEMPIWPGLDG